MSEAFRAGRRRPAFGDLLLPVAACLLAAVAAAAAVSASPAAGEKPLLVPDRIKADTLVILAHPDDEAVVAPLLVRDALEEKQRVVNIYLTPGQFGTDKVGDVKGPALGYLRLTELHWALDRLGVAMFHCLGRMDSGTQTDPGAVLDGWNRDRTVRELTRYIRLLRPGRLLAWFPGPAASGVIPTGDG